MVVRPDLRWTGSDKFTTLNTRNADDMVKPTELTDISNMDYYELGALRKLKGNEIAYNMDIAQTYIPVTMQGTLTTAGTTSIIIPANAVNVLLAELYLGGSGGGGGGGGGAYSGSNGGGGGGGGAGYKASVVNISLAAGTTYQIVVGPGGTPGAGQGHSQPGSSGGQGSSTIFKVSGGSTLYTALGGYGGGGGERGAGAGDGWQGNNGDGDPIGAGTRIISPDGRAGGAGSNAGTSGGGGGSFGVGGASPTNASNFCGSGGGGGGGTYSGSTAPAPTAGTGGVGYARYKITYLEVI